MAVCLWRVLVLAVLSRAEEVDWSPRPTIYDNGGQKSLYAPDGPVHLLRGSSCDLSVGWHSNGQTWMVEYYHSSCPHCWYFAPVFRQLAAAYDGSSAIHVAACNCAAEENRKACDAMQIFRYPSIQVFQANDDGSAMKLYDVSHTDKEGHAKSAVDILKWLEAHELPAAPHPTAAQQGANFEDAKFLSPGSPPGRPGWSWDWRPDDDRFVEARLGLIALLNSYNGLQPAAAHSAALRVATFVAKNCLQECDLYAQLVHRLEAAEASPEAVRAEVARWGGLFARRQHLFCKDETCAVWQLFHVIAASVAAEALRGRLVPQKVSTALQWTSPPTPAEAMTFFYEAVDNFLFCDFCRDHFLRAYDGCEYGRCSVLSSEPGQAKRLVLWLWRMHNAVSLRVLREHPPEGKAIDRRWPTYRDCPGCWSPSVVNGDVIDEDNLDSAFDLDRVYGFLLSSYVGRENVEKHLPLESKVLTDADATHDLLGSTHQTFQIASVLLGATCLALFALRWRTRESSSEACE